jgi:uncharacterized protein (TIGR00255 family)
MTAFGRASKATPLGRFTVEIQTVNRKHLEINCFLSKELSRFDIDVRKWIGNAISRGSVTFKLFATYEQKAPLVITPNLPLVRQLKTAWDKIAEELGLNKEKSFSLNLISKEQSLMTYEECLQDEEAYRQAIREVVEETLKELVQMKDREGKALQFDIVQRLGNLQKGIQQIEKRAPDAPTKYRQKLIERLEEILPGSVENEDRILREIAIYAERVDIAEEITRFQSHLTQFLDLLNSSTESVGKTLEFLVQELNREINTIGSKSADIEITRLVIEIKSELERIREQIQNVE